MHLGLIVETKDPGAVWNGFHLGNSALEAGHDVTAYLLGEGVEAPDQPAGDDVNPHGIIRKFQMDGGELLACARCLDHRDMASDDLRPRAEMARLVELIETADETVSIG
ncbi:MAG: DsrE family protein [Halodesulfurarchaeum sp.]